MKERMIDLTGENVTITKKVEERKMKEFTVKELCEKLNIKEGTFRAWMLKVVEGQVYYRSNVNYLEICKNVKLKFAGEEERIEQILGCKIEDVRIVKKERTRLKGIEVADVVVDGHYEIRNYSLKYNVVVKKIEVIDEEVVYLCKEVEKNEYKVWTMEELMKDNIKIVEAE